MEGSNGCHIINVFIENFSADEGEPVGLSRVYISVFLDMSTSETILVKRFQAIADDFCHNLNFDVLFPKLLIPKLRFLSRAQLKYLRDLKKRSTDTDVAQELLTILDSKPPISTRQLIACLLVDDDHRGHQYIADKVMHSIPTVEAQRIHRLIARLDKYPVRVDTGPSSLLVTKPWDRNYLVGEDIQRRDDELRTLFNRGQYASEDLKKTSIWRLRCP